MGLEDYCQSTYNSDFLNACIYGGPADNPPGGGLGDDDKRFPIYHLTSEGGDKGGPRAVPGSNGRPVPRPGPPPPGSRPVPGSNGAPVPPGGTPIPPPGSSGGCLIS